MGINFFFVEKKKWICFNDVIEGEYVLLVIYLVCEGLLIFLVIKVLVFFYCL